MNITKHSVINFCSSIIIFIFNLAIGIMIAKTLGPEGRGVYFLVFMIAATSFSVVNSSLSSAAVYYIGTKKYSLSDIITNCTVLSLFLGVIGIGLVCVFFKFISIHFLKDVNPLHLKVALLFIPLSLLSTSFASIFMGMDDIPKYNLIMIVRAGLSAFFITIVCFFSRDILLFIMANLLALGITCLFAAILLSRYFKRRVYLNFRLIKDVLIFGWKGHFGQTLFSIVNRLDSYLIKFFLGSAFLGFYSVSLAVEGLWSISTSMGIALFPKVSSSLLEDKNGQTMAVTRHGFFLTCLFCLMFFIFSRPFVKILYGDVFLPAVAPLCLLLPGVAFLSITKTLKPYLSGIGKPQIATYSSMVTILVCVFLNLLFIPRLGIKGAALATTCSYLTYTAIILAAFLKISGCRLVDTIFIKKRDFLMYSNFILKLCRVFQKAKTL
ncbi:MAG: flippase [Candidatus Omnitrophica bacterium]|nr:flippase [Candidatus Omnitrophota bacterium]